IKVITGTRRHDDFVTLGVVGNSVGLVEREHEVSFLHIVRTFILLNPLNLNQVTGRWTPPVGTDHLVSLVSRNQGSSTNAVWAIDVSVEFYNLATQTGFSQPLPGATQQFFSGADVEFDSVNNLFLVAQPNSSTASSGSSIHVYDVSGNLIESINGLNFSNAFNVIPAHIALNPGNRTGFVDGPDIAAGQ